MSIIDPLPTKENFFARLLANKIPITSVVDVGVNTETAELKRIFPNLKHYLFEPVSFFNKQIKKTYKGIDYELFKIALSDKNEKKYLTCISLIGKNTPTHGFVRDQESPLDSKTLSNKLIEVKRFDNLKISSEINSNFLLKIDTDGGENQIIEGFGDSLQKASVVLVESSIYHIVERINQLTNKGFCLVDVVDLCYCQQTLHQFDMAFIRKDLLSFGFQPDWDNFTFEDWKCISDDCFKAKKRAPRKGLLNLNL